MSDLPTAILPEQRLHPYQRQVLHDVLETLLHAGSAAGGKRVVAHLPTGAGKTRIACHVASAILGQPTSEGKVVVWLASSEELCEQAAESLERAWTHLGNREVTLHRFWGSHSCELDGLEEGFLVAGLAKLWPALTKRPGNLAFLSNSTAAVIFDEAHQATARTYKEVTEQLLAYGSPLLGLTATPGRSHRLSDEDEALSSLFNHNKVTIDPKGHDSAVTFLIRQEFLADPDFIFVPAMLNVEVRDPGGSRDYSVEDLTAIGKDARRRELVADLVRQAAKRHKRIIVFSPSVAHALGTAEDMRNDDLRAAAIVASTPSDERQAIIEEFRSFTGGPMVIFNYGVLTAGFDAPRTSCVIVARPTTSLVLYSQMIGRAMRGRQSGGNRTCTIYTVVDQTLKGFNSVVDAFGHWEELWQTQPNN